MTNFELSTENLNALKSIRSQFEQFMMLYKCAATEMLTKIEVLQEEFNTAHGDNPIEHVSTRVKSTKSLLKKAERKMIPLDLTQIREKIHDIAGVRITCSFISNVYELSDILQNQEDVQVLGFKDYIKDPKPNGYSSLHLILQIPIYLSDRVELVPVEVQIRTIAMDFWASLEHKIYYKYMKKVPRRLLNDLKEAAYAATELDLKMESLNNEVKTIKKQHELIDDDDAYLQIKFFEKALALSKH